MIMRLVDDNITLSGYSGSAGESWSGQALEDITDCFMELSGGQAVKVKNSKYHTDSEIFTDVVLPPV